MCSSCGASIFQNIKAHMKGVAMRASTISVIAIVIAIIAIQNASITKTSRTPAGRCISRRV